MGRPGVHDGLILNNIYTQVTLPRNAKEEGAYWSRRQLLEVRACYGGVAIETPTELLIVIHVKYIEADREINPRVVLTEQKIYILVPGP